MADQNQPAPKPGEGQGGSASWRAERVGCLAFFVTLSVCLVVSAGAADLATRNMGRSEVYDAFGQAFAALEWFCGGSCVSVIVAGIVACAAATAAARDPDD